MGIYITGGSRNLYLISEVTYSLLTLIRNRFARSMRNMFGLDHQKWTWKLQFQISDTCFISRSGEISRQRTGRLLNKWMVQLLTDFADRIRMKAVRATACTTWLLFIQDCTTYKLLKMWNRPLEACLRHTTSVLYISPAVFISCERKKETFPFFKTSTQVPGSNQRVQRAIF